MKSRQSRIGVTGHRGEYQFCIRSTTSTWPNQRMTPIRRAAACRDLRAAPLAQLCESLLCVEGQGSRIRRRAQDRRTQLQDAVPMTLGQEFDAFHTTVKEISTACGKPPLVPRGELGATAIGTASPPTPATHRSPSRNCARLGQAMCSPPISSRRRRIWAPLSCFGRAQADRRKLSKIATICACCPPARARASAKSACLRSKPAPRSCRQVNPVIPEL